MSPTRQFIQECMKDLAKRYTKENMHILDIGTAGNQPGENDEWFGKRAASYKTLDKLKELHPDIVYDLTDDVNKIKEHHGKFDIVICSQTIEHVDPSKTVDAIKNCKKLLKLDGLLILDSPGRAVDYHPEPGFDHYGWYTAPGLERLLDAAGLELIADETKMNDLLSLVVGKKND